MESSTLKLYVLDMSQPSRAVMLFCKINNINFEKIHLNFAKKEMRGKEFSKLNPNKQVPVMVDGDFILHESHTILKYLHRTRKCPDNWYPYDVKQ